MEIYQTIKMRSTFIKSVSFLIVIFIIYFSMVDPLIKVDLKEAKNLPLKNETVNPLDKNAYEFKRALEKTKLLLFSPFHDRKAFFYGVLLNRRLAELTRIMDGKDFINLEKASARYSTIAGEYTNYILSNKLHGQIKIAKDQISSHIKIIETLKAQYPNTEPMMWKFVENDANALKIYYSQLGML